LDIEKIKEVDHRTAQNTPRLPDPINLNS